MSVSDLDIVKARLDPTLNDPYFEDATNRISMAKRCKHENVGVILDKIDRTVTCKGCGKPIDPFQALVDYAHSEQRLISTRQAMEKLERERIDRERQAKERRPFVRVVMSRTPVRDTKLKAEPIVAINNTLECGHVVKTGADRIWKTRTCHTCRAKNRQDAKSARRASGT